MVECIVAVCVDAVWWGGTCTILWFLLYFYDMDSNVGRRSGICKKRWEGEMWCCEMVLVGSDFLIEHVSCQPPTLKLGMTPSEWKLSGMWGNFACLAEMLIVGLDNKKIKLNDS